MKLLRRKYSFVCRAFSAMFFFSLWKARRSFSHEPSDGSFFFIFSFRGQVIVSMSVPQALDGINANAEAPTVYLSSHGLVGAFSSTVLGKRNAIRRHLFVTTRLRNIPHSYRGRFCNIFHFKFAVFLPFVETGLTLSTDTLGSKWINSKHSMY